MSEFNLSKLDFKKFPEQLDFNNQQEVEMILHNAKEIATLNQHIQSNKDNELFKLSVPQTLFTHVSSIDVMFKQLIQLIEENADENKIKMKYKMIVLFFNKFLQNMDFQKLFEQHEEPIQKLKEDGFIFEKWLIIGTNKHLIGNNGIYLVSLQTNSTDAIGWTFVNLTAEKNGNHINSSWRLCAWNIYSILSKLLAGGDFNGYFLALGSLLSSVDDKAYHMASNWDFSHWTRFFNNVILGDKPNYSQRDEDFKKAYRNIKNKTEQFLNNIGKAGKEPKIKNQILDIVDEIKQSLLEFAPEGFKG